MASWIETEANEEWVLRTGKYIIEVQRADNGYPISKFEYRVYVDHVILLEDTFMADSVSRACEKALALFKMSLLQILTTLESKNFF